MPTVTTENGAIDDLYLKIVFLEHLSRNYELRIKVLLLRTIIGDRDAAELTRRSLAPPFSLEHILDREVETIRGRNSRVLRSAAAPLHPGHERSEEHTSELQSLMRISYAVFCLKKNN